MVLRHLQPSFTGGEISPALQARTEASAYHTWLKSAKNMWIHPQGGISNRPGTHYLGSAKYSNQSARLIAFPITQEEAYVIEAGAQYFRFYTAQGAVQNSQGSVLEIATPYSAQEVSQVQTAQYNHTLYVAHPHHPLHRLIRTGLGQFTWEEVPLSYGPFQPVNTDPAQQMRVYPQTSTVQSQGVASTLTFEPLNYPNLMVYAYFNDTWFYASDGFGLNLGEIAQYFNNAFGSRGLRAQVQGAILTLTSAAEDGGDWNGVNLVLEYRSHFNGPADLTVTQTLSGGENAGTQTVAQAGRYILESSSSYFTPQHVGGRFCVVHTVPAQEQTGTLGYESVSAAIQTAGDWTLRTDGEWTGTLHVEASADLGQTWKTVKILSRSSGDDNFYTLGNLSDGENLFYVRLRSCQISGEAAYELGAESFIQRGVVRVLGYVSATQVVAAAERAFGSEEWTSQWAQGSFSPAAGYPACVFFFQDRLGLAATQEEKQTLWFSKTGNFTDFGRARDTRLATDALSVRLGGTRLSAIQSVLVGSRLLIFTSGSEWTLSCNGTFSLDSLVLEQQSECGSGGVAPVWAGSRALFVSAHGSCVRDFHYEYLCASYTGDDLTLRAAHLFANQRIVQLAYTQQPGPWVWCVMQDGSLRSLTYLPQQSVYAWTHHQTQGQVISMCVLPGASAEELWLLVKRAGGIYVEKMCARTPLSSTQIASFLDSSVSFYGQSAQTQISGLAHLEGQTVHALADGHVVTGLTVQNGAVTLPYAAKNVQVGLAYQSALCTLPLGGAWAGRKQRFIAVQLHVLESRGGKIGVEETRLTELVQRTHEAYNTPVELQTGLVQVSLACPHQRQPNVWVVQDDPLPLTLLCVEVSAV